MKKRKVLSFFMSLLMTITFCCPSLQVSAAGEVLGKHNAEVAAAKAFGWLGTAGVGALSWALKQQKEKRKELVVQLEKANEELVALRGGGQPSSCHRV